MKVYLGADHTGFELKKVLVEYLAELGHEVSDLGNDHYDPDDNYPDFIFPVAQSVARDIGSMGVLVGGSGQGEAITANKVPKARAIVYYGSVLPKTSVDITGRQSTDPYEIVKLTRLHNNSNILSLGARFITTAEAKEVTKVWLETPFSKLERYDRRNKQDEELAGRIRSNGL